MVVPESLISGKKYRHVVQYIRRRARIEAVLGMPEPLFKTSGKGGTHTKTCLLVFSKKENSEDTKEQTLFMAEAQWCGHDSRGRQIEYDDLPTILENYRRYRDNGLQEYDELGYSLEASRLDDNILAPRYYNQAVDATLEKLDQTHDLVELGELFNSGLLEKTTGDEVGKLAYGTGPIPFVRTSDLSNWEIKVDPQHCISEKLYEKYSDKQDVQPGDILMVKDGTSLIGTCAFITEYDQRVVYQSHLYKIRSNDHEALSPYLLLALLSSNIVQKQIGTKRFTHSIIDSLGSRIGELVLPIPKDEGQKERITSDVHQAIEARARGKRVIDEARQEVITAVEEG